MDRRRFLVLGTAGSGVMALGSVSLLGRGAARAQSSAVPVVDRLVMTNAVDNVYDIFARGGRLDTITVQRTALGVPPLVAEHGLAYHLESQRGAERRQILLDFGLTDTTLFQNYRALQIDPAHADALIVSHGHRDHYGALPELARRESGKLKPGLTLYAGGEDTFCHRFVTTAAGRTDQGQLDRAALEARGLRVVLARQPTTIAGHAFSTGQIARITDFEKPPATARLMAGPMDSACSATHFGATTVEVKPGELVADTFQGEHATCYHVKDRGLVVVTSCGHAGVINSVRQAQKASGVPKVHAVVGGFHTSGLGEERITRVVEAFRALEVDYVVPQHCTGIEAIGALGQRLPKETIASSVGSAFVFAA